MGHGWGMVVGWPHCPLHTATTLCPSHVPPSTAHACAATAPRHQFAEAMSKSSWGDKSRRYFLSHEEEYVEALRGILGVW